MIDAHQHSMAENVYPLLMALIGIDLFLLLMHFVSVHATPPLHHLAVLFDLNKEATIVSWVLSSKMLLVALILCILAYYNTREIDAHAPFLLVISAVFLYLPMDEAAIIHERLNQFIGIYSPSDWRFLERGVWVVVYAIIGAAITAVTYRSMIAVCRAHRSPALIMLCGFALQLAGSLAVEVLGDYYLDNDASRSLTAVQIGVEEFLELLGVSVILYGVLMLSRRIVQLQAVA